ncbi:hypothetical protein SPRG_10076 [Saprolegnia parasitica CBS 223.65]|uniref:Uncharacterized protein n=1 Tax=Saprolegnia parasitica (strain CBS 223.65) TaxID=695850 RepID=A0A067C462_SAPPC|nr:hypothetical protein SPRG_10076 [Saprolegnia parasitica CBS 223.65]KDO23930.1 hypothetical protein SPRG_10076 [Saprolegnia parasitica CBS 223.65]|eukprot:XP_012205395.1 hypothetical protein SPRG_10076 [Saprolegnia parasitica CBS 223.65]
MVEIPVDMLEPIPDAYDGDVFLYLVDTVTNRVIVGDPYPLRVPHGSRPREICHNAINCVMSCCLPLVAIGAGVVSLLGLAPTAPSAVRNTKFLAEHVVSWILPVPSAQDARKGLRIQDIIKLGDPDHKYGGSTTVLRGTADSIATYTREMAVKAGDSVRMA